MNARRRTFLKRVLSPFAVNTTMGFLVGGIPALLPLISDDFGLTRSQVGLYTTFMFLSSVSVALFAGFIVDKIGVKRCLVFGGVVSSCFVAMFSAAPSYVYFLIFAIGLGFGQSILTPAGNKAIITAGEGAVSNMLMGVFRSTLGIGSLGGAAILPLIAVTHGWRVATLSGGLVGITITLLVAFRRYDRRETSEHRAPVEGSFRKSLGVLLRSRSLRFLMITGFCFASVFSVSITYLALWLRDAGGLSEYHAALGLAMAHSGGVVGRPFLGLLSDKVRHLKPVTLLSVDALLVFLILSSFAISGPAMSEGLLLTLSFLLGFTAMGFGGVFFGYLGVVSGQQQAGTATGLVLMFVRSAILAAPPLFGLLVDLLDSYSLPWLMIAFVALVPVIYGLGRRKQEDTCQR